MSLNSVDSSSGELIATGYDGDAVSTAIVQDVTDGNFSSIKNTAAKYEYVNISEATVADTLVTSSPIVDGDSLVIVKDDNTIHEIIASGVSFVPTDGADNPDTESSASGGSATSDTQLSSSGYEPWRAFDNNVSTFYASDGTLPGWIQYRFPQPIFINKFSMQSSSVGSRTAKNFTLEGSNTGVYGGEETVLVSIIDETSWGTNETRTFTFVNSNEFIYYRLAVSASNHSQFQIAELKLIKDTPSKVMDTTAITAGEIPSKVFTVDSKVSFDDGTGFTYPNELDNDYLVSDGVVPAPDLTPGLVAHYLLNNNAVDSFGSFDGTAIGGVDFQGDNAKFDGINDKVITGVTDSGATSTISLWFKGTGASEMIARSTYNRTLNHGTQIYLSSTGHVSIYRTDTTIWTVELHSTTVVNDNLLHHILYTASPSGTLLYVDGVLEASTTATVSPSTSLVWELGHNQDDLWLNGKLSNFRVYNDSKDQSFITALYAEGYYPKPLPLPTTDGLLAHYPLTGTAEDAYGTGTGTQHNSSAFGAADIVADVETGSALSLDGIDGYIEFPRALTFGDTYAMRMKFLPGATSANIVSASSSAYVFNNVLIGYNVDTQLMTLMYRQANGGQYYYYNSVSFAFDPSEWFTVVFPMDDLRDLVIYINDVAVPLDVRGDNNQYPTSYPATNFWIGKENANASEYFRPGMYSDYRIYDRTLTRAEITGIHTGDIPFSPWAHYPFTTEDQYKDTEFSYDGTENGVTYVDDVELGSVLSLDGTSSFIDGTTFPNNDTYRTLSFWVDIDNFDTQNCIIGFYDDIDTRYNFTLVTKPFSSDLVTYVTFNDDTQDIATHTSTPLSANTLYHIVMSFDNGVVKLYVDNLLIYTSDAKTATLGGNAHKLFMGRDILEGYYLKGIMSKVRVYNVALTQQEITDIHNYEKNFRPIDIDDGLVAFYPLAKNSLDNYYNESDGVDTVITYDGESAVFNGTSSEIRPLGSTVLNERSISMWFKQDVNEVAFLMGSDPDRFGADTYGVWDIKALGDGRIQCCADYYDGTSYNLATTNTIVDFSTWQHLVFTAKDNELLIYINGEDVTALGTPRNIGVVTVSNIRFGRTRASSTNSDGLRFLDGNMSKIRLYNKVVSPEQIAIIYNTEKGDFIPEIPPVVSLTNTRQYDDIIVDSVSIETKVELKSINDKCTEVSADLWKNP